MPDAFNSVDEERLRKFTFKFYNESDLVRALEKVGYNVMADAKVSEKEAKESHYVALRNAAIRNDWGVLFAFCVLADRSRERDAEKLAGSLFSAVEMEGFRLFELFEFLDVKEGLLAAAYRESKPDTWLSALPPEAAESRMSISLSICRAQAAAQNKPVLLAFARAVSRSLDEGGMNRLKDWWTLAKQRHGLQGDLTQIANDANYQERYSVIVELREIGTGETQNRRWTRQAWLYRHHTEKFDPLDADTTPATLETIPVYLSDIRNQLAQQHVPLARVTFEFFVSRPSLNCCADQWQIPIDPYLGIENALGGEHAVVIRDLDRRPATQDLVRARWQRLLAKQSLAGADAVDAVIMHGGGGTPNAVYQQFRASSELLCLVVDGPFLEPPDFKKYACVGAALAAGVPLMLWAREPGAAEALKTRAAEILAGPPVSLPDAVQKVRQDLEQELGRHVTLFFEFGDHWLPRNEPLTVPK